MLVLIVTPCPGDDFGCDDGTCINSLLYCDGRVHCPDGSDETPNCSKWLKWKLHV